MFECQAVPHVSVCSVTLNAQQVAVFENTFVLHWKACVVLFCWNTSKSLCQWLIWIYPEVCVLAQTSCTVDLTVESIVIRCPISTGCELMSFFFVCLSFPGELQHFSLHFAVLMSWNHMQQSCRCLFHKYYTPRLSSVLENNPRLCFTLLWAQKTLKGGSFRRLFSITVGLLYRWM